MSEIKNVESSRSWFCVWNNPQKQFGDIEPDEMVNKVIEMWTENKPYRSCGVNYEIGDSGTPHMHMILEDPNKARFKSIQKMFNGIHISVTRGTKAQALDYIHKRGKFEEKEHTVVVPAVIYGDIQAHKGSRKDLEVIQDMLDNGYTPNQIFDIDFRYRMHEKMIRNHYYHIRYKNTPKIRKVIVYWHVGDSGSGKSYTYSKLCKELGDDNVFLMNDYENGGFDTYCGESVLFMDEFKGNLRFQTLLNYLDVYPVQVHCRYSNVYALWTEVHITSVFYPEDTYKIMVSADNQNKDRINQLLRRITYIVKHSKVNGEYNTETIPIDEYLKAKERSGFEDVPCDEYLPFCVKHTH